MAQRLGLDVTLDIADGIVDLAFGLHDLVAGEGADLLLGLAYDVVAMALGVGLGGGFSENVIGLSLLGNTTGDHVRGTEFLADDLLGAAHVGARGICDLLGDIRHCFWGWRLEEDVGEWKVEKLTL